MFINFSKKIVYSAVRKDIVKNEEVDEIIFGLNSFFTVVLNIITALIIGLVLHMVFEIVLFIFIYMMLRKYVGGSHSKTSLRCYLSSCVMYIAVPLIIKYYPFSSLFTVCITVISAIIMFILAPVEAVNKPLDDIERKVFKLRARRNICICLAVFLALHYTNFFSVTYYWSIVFTVSMAVVALFAVTGRLKLNKS